MTDLIKLGHNLINFVTTNENLAPALESTALPTEPSHHFLALKFDYVDKPKVKSNSNLIKIAHSYNSNLFSYFTKWPIPIRLRITFIELDGQVVAEGLEQLTLSSQTIMQDR